MTVQASSGTPATPQPRGDTPGGGFPGRGTPGGAPPQASLSPSRAADFKTCPLLYRFRSIDRLPERPTIDQVRGTLVHAVLEHLFDLPAPQRRPERAAELVEPRWRALVAAQPELADLVRPAADQPAGPPDTAAAARETPDAATPEAAGPHTTPARTPGLAGPVAADPPSEAEFLASARSLLDGYFAVEDPRLLSPAERESLVSTPVDDGKLLLRGYVDRLDVSPAGDLRVVDYKTGGAPREAFEARALFQLKFYALVLWRTRGVVPRVLRLLYLKDAETRDYSPDAEELARFERTLIALWAAIDRATRQRDFRPQPSRLCDWCAHRAHCPAHGGTPPPFPDQIPAPSPDTPAASRGRGASPAAGAPAAG